MENEFKVGNTVKFKMLGNMKVTKVEKGKATCEWRSNGEIKSLLVPLDLLRLIDDDEYKHLGQVMDALL